MAFLVVFCIVALLVLPALVCCFLGGWFLAVGILALGGWGFLFCLVLAEFWHWYRDGADPYDDSP